MEGGNRKPARLLALAKHIAKDVVESRQWPSRPQTINFEITAACDARCIHCPRHLMDRPMRAMPLKSSVA